MYRDECLSRLTGATVKRILINSSYLKLETDDGDYCFVVYGDCCSTSYFWDFVGVRKLLDNGPIVDAYERDVEEALDYTPRYQEYTRAYGVSFVTEDPQFGLVTSVVSFRNDSNGYYGGDIEAVDSIPPEETLVELTEDCAEVPDSMAWH